MYEVPVSIESDVCFGRFEEGTDAKAAFAKLLEQGKGLQGEAAVQAQKQYNVAAIQTFQQLLLVSTTLHGHDISWCWSTTNNVLSGGILTSCVPLLLLAPHLAPYFVCSCHEPVPIHPSSLRSPSLPLPSYTKIPSTPRGQACLVCLVLSTLAVAKSCILHHEEVRQGHR